MICDNCGHGGDWTEAGWNAVGSGQATRGFYECARCGNRQLNR